MRRLLVLLVVGAAHSGARRVHSRPAGAAPASRRPTGRMRRREPRSTRSGSCPRTVPTRSRPARRSWPTTSRPSRRGGSGRTRRGRRASTTRRSRRERAPDISFVRLLRARRRRSSAPTTAFDSIQNDLQTMGFGNLFKKYLVYYDGPVGRDTTSAARCGQLHLGAVVRRPVARGVHGRADRRGRGARASPCARRPARRVLRTRAPRRTTRSARSPMRGIRATRPRTSSIRRRRRACPSRSCPSTTTTTTTTPTRAAGTTSRTPRGFTSSQRRWFRSP